MASTPAPPRASPGGLAGVVKLECSSPEADNKRAHPSDDDIAGPAKRARPAESSGQKVKIYIEKDSPYAIRVVCQDKDVFFIVPEYVLRAASVIFGKLLDEQAAVQSKQIEIKAERRRVDCLLSCIVTHTITATTPVVQDSPADNEALIVERLNNLEELLEDLERFQCHAHLETVRAHLLIFLHDLDYQQRLWFYHKAVHFDWLDMAQATIRYLDDKAYLPTALSDDDLRGMGLEPFLAYRAAFAAIDTEAATTEHCFIRAARAYALPHQRPARKKVALKYMEVAVGKIIESYAGSTADGKPLPVMGNDGKTIMVPEHVLCAASPLFRAEIARCGRRAHRIYLNVPAEQMRPLLHFLVKHEVYPIKDVRAKKIAHLSNLLHALRDLQCTAHLASLRKDYLLLLENPDYHNAPSILRDANSAGWLDVARKAIRNMTSSHLADAQIRYMGLEGYLAFRQAFRGIDLTQVKGQEVFRMASEAYNLPNED